MGQLKVAAADMVFKTPSLCVNVLVVVVVDAVASCFGLTEKKTRKFPGQFHATLKRDESKLGQKARKNEISSKFQITN